MRSIASSAPPRGIAAIVGVGPKLGRSIARKFAHEGYTVAILARDLGRLSRFADEIAREEKAQVFAIRIDCSESRSIREAFEGVLSLGFVEVLVYNAYHPISWTPTCFTDIRLDRFEKSLAISSVGAFHCAQQVLPGMVDRRRGTILFTGCSASLNGIAGLSDLCCAKFATRALSQCLAREFQPLGIHVANVIIDGIIGSPRYSISLLDKIHRIDSRAEVRGTTVASAPQQRWASSSTASSSVGEQQQSRGEDTLMDPDVLAQTYWQLHVQDRSTWTQEIDLRPGGPWLV
ncbi:3-ketodihydrosphingosine reductase [Phtheirospermum japonicum]|uniref:3-ketodihydrosphingosine reductase n=1 Tax=Phtheirospermum japonicum TaxID=374723 RepID=A0A830C888_9LAMI|nr:3-ketodihydrosphingosine reductase [Phtheirospermum japonicum]